MKRLWIALTAISALALAQGPGPGRMREPMGGPGGPGGMMGMARISSKTVKGAPFQATSVTETTQVLADGNRVTNKQTGKVYRDGEGRTRIESAVSSFGPFRAQNAGVTMVSIDDPIAQQHVMLDTSRKTAAKMTLQARPPAADRAHDGGKGGPATMGRRMAPGSAAPGPNAVRPDRKTESLGTQVMEGLQVQGTRETMSIPAGTIGNDRAIDIVTVTWYSPDLQMVVYRKHSDPRSGESVYHLTEVQRAEPDKALFQVPADYTTRAPRGPRVDQ